MKRPALVGILNATPDSFSDAHVSAAAALAQFQRLVADGADIIDIGAESTRPGATALTAADEWRRLEPVLASIYTKRPHVRLSIDTRHAETAARVLAMDGEITINDVGGLRDHAMRELLAGGTGDIVAMHALSIPADAHHRWPDDMDAVDAIRRWRDGLLAQAANYGIAPERLVLDPGIGFGKSAGQSLDLILRAWELVNDGGRWLYGHSRKSFLTLFSDAPPAERDPLTRAFSAMLAQAGVACLRVHDVAGHRALFEAQCM